MDIEDFIPSYPYIEERSFNEDIYAKKELHVNDKVGNDLPHQTRIARYLAPVTLYDRLFIFHEMGTGKTCTAVATIENAFVQDTSISKALIVVKGPSHIDNFINELVFVCAPEKYGHLQNDPRVRSKLKPQYEFTTHEVFAKQVSTRPSGYYDNTIIVIDEVHNLNTKEKDDYNIIHKFLHSVNNCKVMLMSGTPMRDGSEDIADIMNLILPFDKQLPTGKSFTKLFQNNKLTQEGVSVLKEAFKGRVSYLRSNISNVAKKYMGDKMGTLSEFHVFPTTMSSFQTNVYSPLIKNEDDLFLSARQAALFVFPDKSYGSSGFSKHLLKNERRVSSGELKNTYSIKTQLLVDYISDINRLRECSSKYSFILDSLKKNRTKLTFVYCEFVEGSGLVLFSKILEAHGYSRATGKETSEGLRYGIITNMTTTVKQTRRVLDIFNSKENIFGTYIHVILGSRMISEGFTLKNVQETHVITPHWNYSETDQAVARTFRTFSHDNLIAVGVNPILRIYHHVSIPSNNVESIDLKMYETSEKKDLKIKQVERVAKISAFDCPMTKQQNMILNHDGQRVCEYGPCEYTCVVGDTSNIQLDRSTYDMYYSQEEIKKISEEITTLLSKNISVDVSPYPPRLVSLALSQMSKVTNKYGITGYVSAEDDTIYVSKSFYNNTDSGNMFYFANPVFQKKTTLEEVATDLLYTRRVPLLLEDLKDVPSTEIINELPVPVQELLIENSILARDSNVKQTVLSHFNNYIHEVDTTVVSSYLYSTNNKMRCLDGTTWEDCQSTVVDRVVSQKGDVETKAKTFGYYGVTDKTKFLIKLVQEDKSKDKRLAPRGRVCSTVDKAELKSIFQKAGLQYDETKSKKEECQKLYKWFAENNLMVYL